MQVELVTNPTTRSFIMFADVSQRIIREEKRMIVDVKNHTKTTVRLSLIGKDENGQDATNGLNLIPEASNVFSFHTKTEWNYGTGRQVTKNYFKITKKQGYKELIQHIANIIREYLKIEDLSDFTLVLYQTPTLMEIKNNSK